MPLANVQAGRYYHTGGSFYGRKNKSFSLAEAGYDPGSVLLPGAGVRARGVRAPHRLH